MRQIVARYSKGIVRVYDSVTNAHYVFSESRFLWEQQNGPVPKGFRIVKGVLTPWIKTVQLTCVNCGRIFDRSARTQRYAERRGMKGPYCGTGCRKKVI